MLPLCAELDIAYLPYWPLGAGLLTGKYRRGEPMPRGSRFSSDDKWVPRAGDWHTDRNYRLVERLASWAAARGHTLTELAFGWLLAHDQVASVIAGASSPDQLASNAAAAAAWPLAPAEFLEVTDIVGTEPL